MNDFEQKLSRQSLRQIPAEWRAEIVGQASSLSSFEKAKKTETGKMPVLLLVWRELLWPHPKAWAGLAAIWIFIFAVNFSVRDKTPLVAEKSLPPSPEVIAELRQQRLLFAQLMGSTETHDADRQKSFLPRPRTERSFEMLTA